MVILRLPAKIENILQAMAEATGQTKTSYAREIIIKYLDDIEAFYLAKQRLQDSREGLSSTNTLEEVEQDPGLDD
jgi:RHH-type transcriptional regulator, rel operon repressor / antitoxin RelB